MIRYVVTTKVSGYVKLRFAPKKPIYNDIDTSLSVNRVLTTICLK